MTDQLQAAAKAGDIKAIEALMNKAFEPKGLTVRVTNSGRLLKVVIRGKTAPDRALLPTIKAGLANISPQGFDQFVVTARAIGKSNAWSYQGDFTKDEKPSPKAKAASTPPPPQPKPLPKADSVPPKPEVSTATSDAVTGQEQSKAWYQQNWLVISLLILFPLAGIPLTWMSKWPKINKIGASAMSGIWLLSSILLSPSLNPQTPTAQESEQSPGTELAVAAESEAPAPAPATDRSFANAVNAAMAASEAAQAASNPSEWQNVADLWSRAIELMNAVPETNGNYQTAQQKVTEYQANLDYANRNSSLGISSQSTPLPESQSNRSTSRSTSRNSEKTTEEKMAIIDGRSDLASTYGELLDKIDAKCTQNRTEVADIVVKSVEVAVQEGYRTDILDMLAAGHIATRSTDLQLDCVEVYALIITMMEL